MIGLDTNVLLRMFLIDEPAQTAAARGFVAAHAARVPLIINPIVLTEVVWTLATTYKRDKPAILELLDRILEAPEFKIAFAEQVANAMARYRQGPADFADYLIGELNIAWGAERSATFDKDALKSRDLFCPVT